MKGTIIRLSKFIQEHSGAAQTAPSIMITDATYTAMKELKSPKGLALRLEPMSVLTYSPEMMP